MGYRWAADAIVAVHFGFVAFVVLGGLLCLRWPRAAWVHVPAVVWGAFVEYSGVICPLTPLEVSLRERGREVGYAGGFVEHYLIPILYPHGLTHHVQVILGTFVLVLNVAIYLDVIRRWRRSTPAGRR